MRGVGTPVKSAALAVVKTGTTPGTEAPGTPAAPNFSSQAPLAPAADAAAEWEAAVVRARRETADAREALSRANTAREE